MKKPNLNIRTNKNGSQNKADLKRVKLAIKNNFDSIDPAQIKDKNLQRYYSQVKGGKTQGARNAKRLRKADGTFYNALENHAIREAVKDFVIDKQGAIKEEEVFKQKDLINMLAKFALDREITLTKDTGAIIDFLNRNEFKNITLIDQNGIEYKGLSKNETEFTIRENLRELMRVFKGQKFSSWTRYVTSNGGQNIKIYFFDMSGLKDESAETIQELLNLEESAGTFGAYGSPIRKSKNPNKNEKKGAKKSNKQGPNKQRNRVSKKK